MKQLIIPLLIAEKLKNMEFDGFNRLEAVKGELDKQEIYFLQAELKDNQLFGKALADFEVCKIKEIETIEYKFYDSSNKEVNSKDDLSIDPFKDLTQKTILKEIKI